MEEELLLQIEALIFASDHPLQEVEVQQILSVALDKPIELEFVQKCAEQLVQKYENDHFAFRILKSGGGYQFLTKPQFHKLAASLNGDKFTKRLSATSMETLSIIAYRQPITKSEIEFIRGVSSDYSIQKLLEKELICIKGREEGSVGKPLLYATTPYLLDYLGINNPSELPKLKEIVQLETVEATNAKEARPVSQASDND